MRIGILGGSFDPIHKGHLNMAKAALEEYKLDKVWVMPAAHSPNKNEEQMTQGQDRLRMCELAVAEYDNIEVSDFEYHYSDTSYTYMTLQRLTQMYPEHDFFFIMGADSLDYFEKWYHPEIIAELSTILVIIREGFSVEAMTDKIKEIHKLFNCDIRLASCPRYDISSTELREKLRNNEECNEYIPLAVIKYIKKNKLYRPV